MKLILIFRELEKKTLRSFWICFFLLNKTFFTTWLSNEFSRFEKQSFCFLNCNAVHLKMKVSLTYGSRKQYPSAGCKGFKTGSTFNRWTDGKWWTVAARWGVLCVYMFTRNTLTLAFGRAKQKKGKRCENCDKWGECEHAASLSFPGILFLLPFFISGKDWSFCTWRNIPRASGQEAVGLHLFWNMAHGPGSSLFRGELFYSYLPPRNKWVSLRDDKLSSSYCLMRVFDFLGFSLLQVGVHFWWRFS